MKILALSLLLTLVMQPLAASHTPPANAMATTLAAFTKRVNDYARLRDRLGKGDAHLERTAEAAKLVAAQNALVQKIQAARAGAKQGDIFTRRRLYDARSGLVVDLLPNALPWSAGPGQLQPFIAARSDKLVSHIQFTTCTADHFLLLRGGTSPLVLEDGISNAGALRASPGSRGHSRYDFRNW